MKLLSIAALLLLVTLPVAAQHEEVENPHNTAQDVQKGADLFRSHCAVCHGLEGVGDRAPALTGELRHGSSDSMLHETISRGIPGTEMPGVYFNGPEPWQLVAYVRTLGSGAAVSTVNGDAEAGRQIYGARGCSGCHRINGQGGRSGPDLTNIGAARPLPHLRAALVEPNAKVLPGHWRVRATTKDGKTYTGRRLNEDTFSLQILDRNAGLVSLDKSDVASQEVVRDSAMPSYASTIQGDDLENLLTYLVSLDQRSAE